MIILRYLTREITLAFSTITAILLFSFLSNQFTRFLSKVAGGTYGKEVLLYLMAIEVPHLLSILLSLGLYLGILFAYGRLYTDNEMTVMTVGGLSRAKLIQYTLPIIIITVIISAFLSLWANPRLAEYRSKLLSQQGIAIDLQTIAPGRFQGSEGGRIFYIEKQSTDKQNMYNLFVAQIETLTENPAITPWTIATAEHAYQTVNLKNGDRFFVTVHGQRYKGTPGQKDYQIIKYDKYGIRIETQTSFSNNSIEAMPTATLWHAHKDRPQVLAELQWRFAIPSFTFLFALLAIPLSHVQPRQGRYAKLFPAILIYVVFADLLIINRKWIEKSTISPVFGFLWIQALVLVITLLVWAHQIGWKRLTQFWR